MPLAGQFTAEAAKPAVTIASNEIISVQDGHTGEEVIAAASGPGANKVKGFLPHTRLFDIMMSALGGSPTSRSGKLADET